MERFEKKLTKDVKDIAAQKNKELKDQLKKVNEYKENITKSKNKFENILNSDKKNIDDRKKQVINIIDKVLYEAKDNKKQELINEFITQPDIKLYVNSNLFKKYIKNNIKLNDCDNPFPPILKCKSIKYANVKLSWSMISNNMCENIDSFVIQYTLIRENITGSTSLDKLNKKQLKPAKRKSGLFSRIKGLVSHTDDDNKNDSKNDENKDDDDEYSWTKIKVKNKSKYAKKNKYKYELKNLKYSSYYYVCIKSKNKSGLSDKSNILKILTKDLKIKWNTKQKGNYCSFPKPNRVKFNAGPSMVVATLPIEKKKYKKFAWEIECHSVSNSSWIGFINWPLVNGFNYNTYVGSQWQHHGLGFAKNSTSLSVYQKNCSYHYSQNASASIGGNIQNGVKIKFAVDFTKRVVDVYCNGKLVYYAQFTQIKDAIVPAVSANYSPGDYTIKVVNTK